MERVFKDDTLQEAFEADGYIKVPFLTNNEVNDLLDFYRQMKADVKPAKEFGVSYHVSLLNPDTTFRKTINSKLSPLFTRLTANYLNDFAPVVINFILKPVGEGEFSPHQNWTFVDESKYTSLSLWIPLQDVDATNGAVEVVRGSHRHFRHVLRGPTLPTFFYDYAAEIQQKYMQRIDVKAGEALMFDDSIIHCSMPNRSANERIVVHCIAAPAKAKLNHYVMKKSVFGPRYYAIKVDKEYYLNHYNPKEIPSLQGAEKAKYKMPKITLADFEKVLKH